MWGAMQKKSISFRGFLLWGSIILIFAVGAIILLSRDRLAYRKDPDVVVIYASIKSWPGGYLPGQTCNQIPELRIWGDGRIVFSEMDGGVRRVFVGTLGQAAISTLLEMLDQMDFFNNPPPDSLNEAGTGYSLRVILRREETHSFWAVENDIFNTLLAAIEVENLELFVPAEGLLMVGPYSGILRDAFPQWPADFPFSLAEVGQEGRWVDGEVLSYAWDTINHQPDPLTGVEENGILYAIGLEIKGISLEDPPYDCWYR
jgi:hypothetical protein